MKRLILFISIILLFANPLFAADKMAETDDMNGTADNTYIVWVSHPSGGSNPDGHLTIPQFFLLGVGSGTDLESDGSVTWGNLGAGELADNSVLAADISPELEYRVKDVTVEYPESGGNSTLKELAFESACTVVRIDCCTDTGTANMNLGDEGGDDGVLLADIVCDACSEGGQSACASGCDVESAIDTDEDNFTQFGKGFVILTSTANSPTKVHFHVYYTVDD